LLSLPPVALGSYDLVKRTLVVSALFAFPRGVRQVSPGLRILRNPPEIPPSPLSRVLRLDSVEHEAGRWIDFLGTDQVQVDRPANRLADRLGQQLRGAIVTRDQFRVTILSGDEFDTRALSYNGAERLEQSADASVVTKCTSGEP